MLFSGKTKTSLDSSYNSVLVKINLNEKSSFTSSTIFKRQIYIYFLPFLRGHALSLPVGQCCSLSQSTAAAPLDVPCTWGQQHRLPVAPLLQDSRSVGTWGWHVLSQGGPGLPMLGSLCPMPACRSAWATPGRALCRFSSWYPVYLPEEGWVHPFCVFRINVLIQYLLLCNWDCWVVSSALCCVIGRGILLD